MACKSVIISLLCCFGLLTLVGAVPDADTIVRGLKENIDIVIHNTRDIPGHAHPCAIVNHEEYRNALNAALRNNPELHFDERYALQNRFSDVVDGNAAWIAQVDTRLNWHKNKGTNRLDRQLRTYLSIRRPSDADFEAFQRLVLLIFNETLAMIFGDQLSGYHEGLPIPDPRFTRPPPQPERHSRHFSIQPSFRRTIRGALRPSHKTFAEVCRESYVTNNVADKIENQRISFRLTARHMEGILYDLNSQEDAYKREKEIIKYIQQKSNAKLSSLIENYCTFTHADTEAYPQGNPEGNPGDYSYAAAYLFERAIFDLYDMRTEFMAEMNVVAAMDFAMYYSALFVRWLRNYKVTASTTNETASQAWWDYIISVPNFTQENRVAVWEISTGAILFFEPEGFSKFHQEDYQRTRIRGRELTLIQIHYYIWLHLHGQIPHPTQVFTAPDFSPDPSFDSFFGRPVAINPVAPNPVAPNPAPSITYGNYYHDGVLMYESSYNRGSASMRMPTTDLGSGAGPSAQSPRSASAQMPTIDRESVAGPSSRRMTSLPQYQSLTNMENDFVAISYDGAGIQYDEPETIDGIHYPVEPPRYRFLRRRPRRNQPYQPQYQLAFGDVPPRRQSTGHSGLAIDTPQHDRVFRVHNPDDQ